MQKDISAADLPHVRLKNGCRGGCPYYRQVCSLDAPQRPGLGGNHPKLFCALEDAQIETLPDVSPDFPGLGPEHLLVL